MSNQKNDGYTQDDIEQAIMNNDMKAVAAILQCYGLMEDEPVKLLPWTHEAVRQLLSRAYVSALNGQLADSVAKLLLTQLAKELDPFMLLRFTLGVGAYELSDDDDGGEKIPDKLRQGLTHTPPEAADPSLIRSLSVPEFCEMAKLLKNGDLTKVIHYTYSEQFAHYIRENCLLTTDKLLVGYMFSLDTVQIPHPCGYEIIIAGPDLYDEFPDTNLPCS